MAPFSSSNSATSLSAWLVTLSASSTTAGGTASDEGVSLFRLLASPGPGPLWLPFLPVPPLPLTCTVEPGAPPPLLPLAGSAPLVALAALALVLLVLVEDVADGEVDELDLGCSAVSFRTSSRICFRSTGKVVASPERRRARARFCTCVGQL